MSNKHQVMGGKSSGNYESGKVYYCQNDGSSGKF